MKKAQWRAVVLVWTMVGICVALTISDANAAYMIQEGNTMAKTRIEVKRSPDLLDNRIGGDYGSDPNVANHIFDLGLKWVRLGFWNSGFNWQRVRRAQGSYAVDPAPDKFVTDLAEGGITVVMTMGVGDGRFREDDMWRLTPSAMDDYREYARTLVQQFKDRVQYFEIWNEPDTGTDWGRIPPSDYARLVRHVAPAIREEAPEARIVIGAIGGWWQPKFPGYGNASRYTLHLDYLKEVLCSGIAPLVDVISWHPFYGHRPEDPYYQNYPQMVEEIQRLATVQGFKGEYLVEEALWRVERADEPQGLVSAIVSAKYIARTIVMHRGLGITVTVSGMFPGKCPDVTHRLCTILAGAEAVDLPVVLQTESSEVVHYGFQLPNGDRLIALWSNGAAVDDDSGVVTDVTYQMAASGVIGADVLHGYQQDLDFESGFESTRIRGLYVPDYPMLIRLQR